MWPSLSGKRSSALSPTRCVFREGVDAHKSPKTSLGAIIKKTYERRQATTPAPLGFGVQPARAAQAHARAAVPQEGRPRQGPGGDWNKNQCKGRDCKRLHARNRVLKNGRACGMRNHTSRNSNE